MFFAFWGDVFAFWGVFSCFGGCFRAVRLFISRVARRFRQSESSYVFGLVGLSQANVLIFAPKREKKFRLFLGVFWCFFGVFLVCVFGRCFCALGFFFLSR